MCQNNGLLIQNSIYDDMNKIKVSLVTYLMRKQKDNKNIETISGHRT